MRAWASSTPIRLLLCASAMETLLVLLRLQGDLRFQIPEAVGLLLLTAPFYLVSVYLVLKLRTDDNHAMARPTLFLIVVAALLFRLTIWGSAPALSDDVFRYRWEGKLQAAAGNPYQTRPSDPAWEHLRDETFPRVSAPDAKAGYGPLVELFERWTYRAVAAVHDDAYTQAFWFKAPAALFDLGTMAALALLLAALGLPAHRLLIYAWSPLPVIEFWGSGHNDSVALLFIVLALWCGAKQRWWWAFSALSLAACAKIWPLALFPVFVGWQGWRPRRWYQWTVLLPITGALALPFWSNVEENARYMSGFLGGWRNNDSLYGLLLWLTGDQYPAKDMAFGILIGAALLVTWRRWPLERACLAIITLMLMVSANCHPWYLTWIVPLLVVVPVPALLLWTALTPLAYKVVIAWALLGEWDGSTPWRWLIYVPVYGMLLGTAVLRRMRLR